PCANAGLNSAVPSGVTEDIDGNPRIVNGMVDIGAYEFVGPVSLPRYEIIDLGTLGGGYSEAHGINEAGQIVGVSRTSAGHKHAFIWDAANGMSDLGTLGGSESVAYGLNGLGQVVGSSGTSAGRLHAFLWESGMMTDLGTLGGGLASEARAINDAGQVVGESRTDKSDYSWQRAFVWQDAVMTDLGVLPEGTGNRFSAAFDISASGRIVGAADERAFLWEDLNGNGLSDPGEMLNLGLIQSGVSGAYGINEMGQVVGTSSGGYAFIWDSFSGMVDLGLDKKSTPRSINDAGQIAGWFEYTSDDDLHAFLWDAISGRIDLNQFLTDNSTWSVLYQANSINNHGQIVGSGYTKSGRMHAFLMTPLAAESSLVAHWKLDELAGDKAEDSAGTNPGTLQGDPQWLPAGGRVDGALAFDGDDYVDCGSGGAFDIAEKITVSAWVRIDTVSKDWQAIVTKGDSAWRLSTANDERKFHFSVTGGPPWIYVNGQTEVAAYEWHHVCGTYDGQYMRLYVDGAEDAGSPVAYSGGIGTSSYAVYIGENAERPERHWEGAIDDVRIYSQALSAFEVYRLYRQAPIYVDAHATGANNGSSWADAFRYLQDALYSAPVSGEIRVADGIYRPDEGAHVTRWDRQATFALMDGLAIKGGYAGLGQANPGARDVHQYVTVLSGDLNGNDGPYSAGRAENSYHVVTADGIGATAVLDGVTISGGNANAGAPHDRGAGMYILSASPTLLDCTLSDNTASIGGGLFNSGGNPRLLRCTFSENSGTGGGMYSSGRATLTDCVFASNAGGRGAGISNTGYARLFNCVFVGNSSLGATDNDGGGGLYSSGGTLLVNCVLSGNTAQSKGGGLWSRGSRTRLVNCSFSANLAPGGKALACDSIGEPSSVFVANCILWDGGGEIRNRDGSTITVTNSNIRGGHVGEGNIDADPLFEDADGPDNTAGTKDDDLRLSAGSPCINTGDNAVVIVLVSVDLDGSPRVIHDLVDMGAYEFVGMLNWYVDGTNGSDNNDGLSRANAFATIQKGINSAGNGYKVLVYPGVYREPIDFRGKAIEVTSAEDAAVLETPGDYAVSFYSAEGSGSILSNFVIRNSALGIFVSGASPKITNVTFVQNQYGVAAYTWGKPDIRNSIFWYNSGADLFQCQATYSCIERPSEGEGNISTDPLFADPAAGDFHLLSERGRYRPSTDEWILDEVTSPCVDSADPKVKPAGERMPNGARLNMGAYGGTAYGSMSEWRIEGDINRDGVVSLADFAIVAENWLEQAQWYK
ncbi:MAG: right-handed parallel beta-helix repeat-containing protein, partial [Phycisphaerales bacterium]